MKLVVLETAERDVADITAFLECRESGLGNRFVLEFQRALNRIKEFPERYSLYSRRIRLCPLRVFRAGIYYTVAENMSVAIRVIDLRRGRRAVNRALRPW